MPIPGLIILNLIVGASVAFAARVQLRNLQRPVFANRYFTALVLMEVVVLLPVGVYFRVFYEDWSWMYLVDGSALPPGVGVMAMGTYPLAATMGFLVGTFAARSSSDWLTGVFLAVLAAALAGLFVVADDKLLWLGSYDQYHRNVGLLPLAETSLLPSVLLTWCGILVCWAHLLYRFVREGRLAVRATA